MSFSIPAPYSPATQASALWKGDGGNATTVTPRIILREDDVSKPRMQNYGGLNVEHHVADVFGFYDPRTVSMRAPILAPDGDTLPGMRHGAAPLIPEDLPAPREKCVFSLSSADSLLIDPVVLYPREVPCSCPGLCLDHEYIIRPYSMAALVYSVVNAIKIRDMLKLAGVVVVTEALEKLTSRASCVCAVFGAADDFRDAIYNLAADYNDVPVITTADPVRDLSLINTAYVQKVLNTARTLVNEGLKANYTRVEGNRVYLQDYPQYQYDDPTPRGTGYVDRSLADPRGSRTCNRLALAYLTGLPLSK